MSRHHLPRALAAALRTGALCTGALCTGALVAQVPTPDDPPPWWGEVSDDTVSLYWSFDNLAAPFVPDFSVVPPWYVPPANNGFTTSTNVGWIPALAGHVGVLGFTGAGTGTVSDVVDNDPRYDWIKVFFLQYDSFAAGASVVSGAIRQDLAQYKRSIISEKVTTIANGWLRTSIQAQLLPQPDFETVDFTLTGAALTTVAIDNLFVNSKCIKPPPDEEGDPLGETDAAMLNIDLGAATGNPDCTAVAATEDAAGVLRYWVATRSPNTTQFHRIVRLDQFGQNPAPANLTATPTQSPLGATDLAVARFRGAGGTTLQFVYAVVDQRSGGGAIELFALDAATPTPAIVTARTIALVPTTPIPPQPLGLAFSPHGDAGAGTFWITDQSGNAYEFALSGQQLRTVANLPNGVTGAGYDPLTAKFYFFSNAPRQPRPGLVTQVNGIEYSAYDFTPTGVVFFGDLRLPNPGGPPGGVARGLEVMRRNNGDFELLCVQQAISVLGQQTSFLRTLKGPYSFGWNLLGRCGMQGAPFEGSPNFQLTLTGVPRATFAMLYAGFSNRQFGGQQLPFSLAPFGLPESNISVALQLNSALLPVTNGRVAFPLPLLPPGSGLAYVPMFFQWLVFDPTAPGGIATSQAGKTVIYGL